jgi:hypothetical protein
MPKRPGHSPQPAAAARYAGVPRRRASTTRSVPDRLTTSEKRERRGLEQVVERHDALQLARRVEHRHPAHAPVAHYLRVHDASSLLGPP